MSPTMTAREAARALRARALDLDIDRAIARLADIRRTLVAARCLPRARDRTRRLTHAASLALGVALTLDRAVARDADRHARKVAP